MEAKKCDRGEVLTLKVETSSANTNLFRVYATNEIHLQRIQTCLAVSALHLYILLLMTIPKAPTFHVGNLSVYYNISGTWARSKLDFDDPKKPSDHLNRIILSICVFKGWVNVSVST